MTCVGAASTEAAFFFSSTCKNLQWWDGTEIADRCAGSSRLGNEDHARALLRDGEIHAAIGDYAGAEGPLKASLAIRPDFETALNLAELLRDRPEEALSYARQAAGLAPDAQRKATARDLQASILNDLGDSAGSQEAAAQALSLVPDDLEALGTLADLNNDDRALASSYADKARRSAEAAPLWYRGSACRLSARIFRRLGDDGQAAQILREALRLDPLDVDALQSLLQIKSSDPRFQWPPLEISTAAGREESATPPAQAATEDLEALRQRFEASRAARRKRESLEDARRFASFIPQAPFWLRYDAYRLCANLWIELDQQPLALRCLGPLSSLSPSRQKIQALESNPLDPADAPEILTAQDAARAYAELGDTAAARTLLERTLRSRPDDFGTLRQMVELLSGQRQAEAALPYAQRMVAIAEKGSRASALHWISNTSLAEWKERNPEFQRELAGYFNGERELAFRALCKVLDNLGRLKQELACEQQWVQAAGKQNPEAEARALTDMARVQEASGDAPGAAQTLRRALDIKPEDGGTLRILIESELRLGQTKEAATAAQALVAATENGAPEEQAAAWREKARVQEAEGDAAGADRSLERVLSLSPHDIASQWELIALGEEPAASLLRLAIRWEPSEPVARAQWLVMRGFLHGRLGQRSQAREDFGSAVRQEARAACQSSLFQQHRGILPAAYFDQCLARLPGDAELYSDRGVALYEAGLRRRALQDFRTALRIKPRLAEASLSLASALAAERRRGDALEVLKKALAIDTPPVGEIHEQLSALKTELDRSRDAGPN